MRSGRQTCPLPTTVGRTRAPGRTRTLPRRSPRRVSPRPSQDDAADESAAEDAATDEPGSAGGERRAGGKLGLRGWRRDDAATDLGRDTDTDDVDGDTDENRSAARERALDATQENYDNLGEEQP